MVRDHLRSAHGHELHKLSNADLEVSNIFLCRECDNRVFATSNTLASHVKKFHLETRNKINLDVVHELIFDSDCGQSHWSDALAFLKSLPL